MRCISDSVCKEMETFTGRYHNNRTRGKGLGNKLYLPLYLLSKRKGETIALAAENVLKNSIDTERMLKWK